MQMLQKIPAILLVEDDPDDVALTRHAFQKARLANPMFVVRDGEEALEYLTGQGPYGDRERFPRPFLILLDLHMPKLNGFEVLRWIKSQPELAGIRVVVLTSSQDQRDFRDASGLGADSYYRKPGSL